MGAIVCCVYTPEAEALEEPLVEAVRVIQDDRRPFPRTDSTITHYPSR